MPFVVFSLQYPTAELPTATMATACGRTKREWGSWGRHQKRTRKGHADSIYGKNERLFGGKGKNGPGGQEGRTGKKNQRHSTTRRCLNPGEESRRTRKLIISTGFCFPSLPTPSFLRIQTAGRCVVSDRSAFVPPVSDFSRRPRDSSSRNNRCFCLSTVPQNP